MTREQFQKSCNTAFSAFQDYVPNPKTRGSGYYINKYGHRCKCSTGNMAFNASKIEFTDDRTCNIYVDENIAPYVPYTNENGFRRNGKEKRTRMRVGSVVQLMSLQRTSADNSE